MKKLLLTACLVVVFGLSNPNVALSGLVAHYPFSGNANDVISGYNGTVHGAVLTTDRFGNENSAYSFDGTNDYIDIPEFLTPDTPAITISAWVKRDGINDVPIVYKGLESGEIALRTDISGVYGIAVKLSDGNWFYASGGTIYQGQWQFVVGTYSKGDKIAIWVDGVLEDSTNISNLNLWNGNGAPALSSIASYQKSYGYFFKGVIDDVAVYNHVLSSTEIQALAKDRPQPPVPEPTTMLLLGLGLMGVAGMRRKLEGKK